MPEQPVVPKSDSNPKRKSPVFWIALGLALALLCAAVVWCLLMPSDAERIYQVITNLLSNALKFTPEKGSIRVRARTVDRVDGRQVEVSIQDSGVGIRRADLERIFNKYEQVSLQSPEGATGLGLGLSTCKTIVQMHQGRIWAKSNLGRGSTFSFRIPVAENASDSPG